MYNAFRQTCERLLRIPPEPEPPPGNQSSTRVFRAAPNFYKYLLVMWTLASVLAFLIICSVSIGPVAGFIALNQRGEKWAPLLLLIPGVLLAVFILARLIGLAVLRLDFDKRWYVVTDRSLRIREGVVTVREMTVTFANIQNISIAQGPIQRWLGIADLRVDTAGGGGAAENPKHPGQNLHVARFRGIDNANAVHELIQERLRHLKDSGLGDHDELARRLTFAASSEIIAALREVHAEATALRQALSQEVVS